jgi:hypothetical protein
MNAFDNRFRFSYQLRLRFRIGQIFPRHPDGAFSAGGNWLDRGGVLTLLHPASNKTKGQTGD